MGILFFVYWDTDYKFAPAERITQELRKLDFHNKTQRTIQDLATLLNPKIRGWLNYYGKINRRCMRPVKFDCIIKSRMN